MVIDITVAMYIILVLCSCYASKLNNIPRRGLFHYVYVSVCYYVSAKTFQIRLKPIRPCKYNDSQL